MSDIDNNELDSYGVWVKKPPRTVDSSAETTDDPFGSFDISTDTPDFSSLDEGNETIGTAEETMSETKSEEDILNGTEEEISLDEFITGGVFETGPDEDKIREKEAEKAAAAGASEETAQEEEPASEDLSLDTFTDASSFVSEDNPVAEDNSPAPSLDDDDDTLNIDLSFDDEPAPAAVEESVSIDSFTEESPAPSDDGTESVDLSEFGIDEFNDSGAAEESSQTPSDEGGSFDDLFNSDEQTDAAGNDDMTTETSSGEESVDLSDFGVDFGDDQAAPQETAESQEPVITEESSEDDSFSIDMDDDSEGETIADDAQTSSFAQENDSDFDVDDILNSAQDEDGRTVTVGSQEEALVKEVSDIPDTDIPAETEEAEIQEETIEDFSGSQPSDIDIENAFADIPDTFDEETASLTSDELTNIAESVVSTHESNEDGEIDFGIPSDSAEHAVAEEAPAPAAASDSTVVANSILQDIVGQLNSLKTEISTLKNDFAELRNNNAVAPAATTDASETEEDSGFFSEDGDDTIALSTDELNNILNTSEITEEVSASAEAPAEPASQESLFGTPDESMDIPEQEYENDAGLSMDFSNDNLVEPNLDDLDMDSREEEPSAELPDDISIPKVDDILVDSSSTDLMEPISNDNQETEEPAAEISDAAVEELSEDELNAETEEAESLDEKSFEDIFAPEPSISETLTDDKISYLEDDQNSQADTIEASMQPKEFDSTPAQNESSSIPGELKSEIKSVLSYMDQLLENLPEDKIAEFAQSEQFETYKKLFKELGLS